MTCWKTSCVEFNPWLSEDQARAIVETIEALPPTIEGNWEVLRWMRGEHKWWDENEKRSRSVQLIEFDDPGQQRAPRDLGVEDRAVSHARATAPTSCFVVNGMPVAIVEHKNPKDGDALTRGIKQLRRYEIETPELLAQTQLYNVTHLIGYWYGVTWNARGATSSSGSTPRTRSYRSAVQAFFEPHDFLRTLQRLDPLLHRGLRDQEVGPA